MCDEISTITLKIKLTRRVTENRASHEKAMALCTDSFVWNSRQEKLFAKESTKLRLLQTIAKELGAEEGDVLELSTYCAMSFEEDGQKPENKTEDKPKNGFVAAPAELARLEEEDFYDSHDGIR